MKKIKKIPEKIEFGDKNYHRERLKSLRKRKNPLIIRDRKFTKENIAVISHADGFADGFKLGERLKRFCIGCGLFLPIGELYYCKKCEDKFFKEMEKEFGEKK